MNSLRMADLAREAGVHPSTVSRALRNDPRLPAATRRKIQNLAKKRGYRPNPLVSALISERRKKSQPSRGTMLAYLLPDLAGNRWRPGSNERQLFEAVRKRAKELGYSVDVLERPAVGGDAATLRRVLLARGIRGLIVAPLAGGHRMDFDFGDFAAVALGYTLHWPVIHRVAMDYFGQMAEAFRRLEAAGFRRIGLALRESLDDRSNHLWLGACLAEQSRLPARRQLRPFVGGMEPAKFLDWVAHAKPDAILTHHFELPHLNEWLKMAGKHRIIRVANLDCRRGGSECGIVQSLEDQGRAAVDWVTQMLERAEFGLPRQPRVITIAGTWREAG